jgi:hypothetical protein
LAFDIAATRLISRLLPISSVSSLIAARLFSPADDGQFAARLRRFFRFHGHC